VPSSHDATPHDPAVDHRAKASGVSDARETNAPPIPDVARASVAADAHFTIRVAPSIASPASGAAGEKGSGGASETAVIVPEAAVSAPARLLASIAASYPPEARANEVEADVSLEIVVDTVGVVVEARPLSRAGLGFDEAALSAIRRYRFSPAQKDGHPVRVRMRWSVQFRLR
jgi:TonB family protein